MRIHYELSRRTAENDLKTYIQSNPSLTREEAINKWIINKFKPWITNNINEDDTKFVIQSVTDEPIGFIVTFQIEEDGKRFLSMLGGQKYD
ncbi:hypothetical protein A6U96_14050 [Agrobacterium tumefaciens]|nr:hypothetical protein A6U96_14050 [Agrobacterium tumefaciens]